MTVKKYGKFLYIAAIVALAAIFLYSAGSLISYFLDSKKSQGAYDDLASLVEHARPTSPPFRVPNRPDVPSHAPSDATAPPVEQETDPAPSHVTVVHPETDVPVDVLPEYVELFLLNPDLVGWISIEDSIINYPVVQTGTDRTDYYLYRDFHRDYSSHGCIYVREQCDVFAPSDNLTIYGHRMKDNTMFGQLAKYESKSYWELHPFIRFDTISQRQMYQIICVFKTTATVGEGFTYHRFSDAANPEEFDTFLRQCKALALYDTALTAQYGDKLITLSTCEYSQQNGRLVVVAKRIWQEN